MESNTKIRFEWYDTQDKVFIKFYVSKNESKDYKISLNGNTLKINDWEIVKEFNEEVTFVERKDLEKEIVVILEKLHPKKWFCLEKQKDSDPDRYKIKNTIKNSYLNDFEFEDEEIESVNETKNPKNYTLNDMLQDIYSKGTPEQRKAMDKSFIESNFTVLSNVLNENDNKNNDSLDNYKESERECQK